MKVFFFTLGYSMGTILRAAALCGSQSPVGDVELKSIRMPQLLPTASAYLYNIAYRHKKPALMRRASFLAVSFLMMKLL